MNLYAYHQSITFIPLFLPWVAWLPGFPQYASAIFIWLSPAKSFATPTSALWLLATILPIISEHRVPRRWRPQVGIFWRQRYGE